MIGSIAGILTTFAFVPQVIKIVKTKNTEAISLQTCLLQVIGVFLWTIHGIIQSDMAILGANAVTLCLTTTILVCKIGSRKREDAEQEASNCLEEE